MKSLFRSGLCALALLAATAAVHFEPTLSRDMAFGKGQDRLTIAAVTVPFWSAAFAQAADSFTLDNVTLTVGTATYRAKRVAFSGVSTPRAEIEEFLRAGSSEALPARLARLSAKQMTIPELVIEQRLGSATQRVTYRNIVVSDVVEGRVATMAADTAVQEFQQGKGTEILTQGRSTVSALDLPALARLYLERADAAVTPLVLIYGGFTVDDIAMTTRDGSNLKIRHIAGRDFKARPTEDSWTGTIALLASLAEKEKPTKEDETRIIPAVADLLSAMQIGFVEMNDMEIVDRSKDAGSAKIDRITYSSASGAQPADSRIEGMRLSSKDAEIAIDTLAFTGFSFTSTLEGMRSLKGRDLKDLDATTLRSLIPTIGTMRMSGFSIDAKGGASIKNKGGKDTKSDAIKASLGELELTADKPVNGIASNVRFGLSHLAMSLPSASNEDGIADLIALGYSNLDLSLVVDASWNETASEVAIREVSIDGKDMGRIALRGSLSEVTKDVFNPDTAVATVALMGAKAKFADLVVENTGLFDRFLAREAREQKTKPESLRRSYGMAAAVLIPSMLGSSPQAESLSRAVAKFIAKPGRLTINAQTKNGTGIGVTELAAQPDPVAILGKLDITAKAE